MSSLNSLFNRGLLGARCKTCLNLSISRIKLLRNKREMQLALMRKEISRFLQTGQEAIARIRVEHVIQEENTLAAYEIIELFCEFILARVPILDTQRTCPPELLEAIASVIFAAPRCSDVQELIQIKNLFTNKYGKEFVSAASELRPDSGVNRVIIEKLSVKTPPPDVRLAVLKSIAQEYNLDWDSSNTEAELCRKHEDLLDGLNPSDIHASTEQSSVSKSLLKDGIPVNAPYKNQVTKEPGSPPIFSTESRSSFSNSYSPESNKIQPAVGNQTQRLHDVEKPPTIKESSSDVLEKARVAIAAADRACAAARAAAKLIDTRMDYSSLNNKQLA